MILTETRNALALGWGRKERRFAGGEGGLYRENLRLKISPTRLSMGDSQKTRNLFYLAGKVPVVSCSQSKASSESA
jgi:hypothetical protein